MDRSCLPRGPLAVVAGLGLALALAACGPTAVSPTATATATGPVETVAPVTAAPTPTALVTPEPTETPVAAAPLCADDQQACPLQAGTYTTAPFEPAFAFTVGDGWTNDRLYADGGQLLMGEASFVWVSNVRSGQVAGVEVEIDPGVDGVLAYLGQFGFGMTAPVDVEIDGAEGVWVDVSTGDVDASGILLLEGDSWNLAPGEKARFFVVEKDGSTVILIIDAWHAAEFEAFLMEAQPLVDSLRWQ